MVQLELHLLVEMVGYSNLEFSQLVGGVELVVGGVKMEILDKTLVKQDYHTLLVL
jgi:hypothetical protein